MALPLSVFLITRNEAARLPRTLGAVCGWADQVVVVDSGSDDATCDIARAAGAELHTRAFDGYGPQKRFAEDLCRYDWCLNIDADEVVTPELAAEIDAFLSSNPEPGLCHVRILNVYPGDHAPRRFANDYNVVRLYHRAAGRYRDDPLFDRVEPVGTPPMVQLQAPVHHFPYLSFSGFVAKLNGYTDFTAYAARPRRKGALLLRLPFEGLFWFLRFYLGRRHVFGGWKGFAFAVIAAYGRVLRIIKLLERIEREPPEPEPPGTRD